jgi:DNA-binding beta-propeller fold protein YncE
VLGNERAGRSTRAIAAIVAGVVAAAGLTLAGGPVDAAPTSALSTWTVDSTILRNGGVAWDGADQLLVSVSADEAVIGNHLVELDPATGELGRTVFVGSDPQGIAVSDDGTRAYVVLADSPIVVEVDLADFTVERRIRFLHADGEVFVTDVAVKPGDASVVAAALWLRGDEPAPAGVALADDGDQKADTTGADPIVSQVAFGASPTVLYGYDDRSHDGNEVSEMAVGVDGVTLTAAHPAADASGPGAGSPRSDLVFADGTLFTSNASISTSTWAVSTLNPSTAGTPGWDQGNAVLYRAGGIFTGTLLRGAESRALPTAGARELVDVGVGVAYGTDSRVVVAGPGIDLDDFDAPAAPAELQQRADTVDLPLRMRDIVVSADERLVYVAERQAARVSRLDPVTGEVVDRLSLSGIGVPSVVELSDDASTLYLGFDSEAKVVEVDTETFQVVRTVSLALLGPDLRATSIAPVPGDASSYAVAVADRIPFQSQSRFTTSRAVVLVRDGVVQSDRIVAAPLPSSVTFAGDDEVLYGVDGMERQAGTTSFVTMAVAGDGLAAAQVAPGVTRFTEANDPQAIEDHDGLLYATSGEVVDPQASGGPLVVGRYQSFSSPDHMTVLPDEESGRAFIATGYALEADLDQRWEVTRPSSLPPLGSDATPAALMARNLVMDRFSSAELIPIGDDATFPAVPFAAEADAFDDEVVVDWDEPLDDGGSPVTEYRVYKDGVLLETVAADVFEVTDADVVEGERYEYELTAVNAEGESTRTAVLPAIPGSFVSFPDVPEGHPFWLEVRWAVLHGITTGYPDGTFRPSAAVTRQSMAAFLYRLAGAPEIDTEFGIFVDVNETHPFYTEIAWAVEEGITTGYSDDTYRGGAPVTRQAMAAFLHRFVGEPAPTQTTQTFSDVSPSHPFFTPIAWAAEAQITGGYVDGTFRPGATVTRQAAAAFLYRLAEG